MNQPMHDELYCGRFLGFYKWPRPQLLEAYLPALKHLTLISNELCNPAASPPHEYSDRYFCGHQEVETAFIGYFVAIGAALSAKVEFKTAPIMSIEDDQGRTIGSHSLTLSLLAIKEMEERCQKAIDHAQRNPSSKSLIELIDEVIDPEKNGYLLDDNPVFAMKEQLYSWVYQADVENQLGWE
ncbi:MAG: hypothetical protein MMC23_002258 [Stictis urceolatum]|nr:hypothetical protein [Stictis urceolata]